MYIVEIKSKDKNGFECIDTFNLPEQSAIRNLFRAYDLLEEKVLSFKCRYGE